MNDAEESDEVVVPEKRANKDCMQPAEPVEERTSAERNAQQPPTVRSQTREAVSKRLERIRHRASGDPDSTFNNLFSLLSTELLEDSFYALKRNAAAGLDKQTWASYREDLTTRLSNLNDRLHRGSYRATPARRTYIDKEDGSQRALGIQSLEDKIVQQACVTILNQIYEVDFLGFSYGFRQKRRQHDALDALASGILHQRINWILDADIQGFFDEISHDWLYQFLGKRITDPRLLRLLEKWLKCGWVEDGVRYPQDRGTPQGSVISPLLANIYLHYALDTWVHWWRSVEASGNVIIVRYADDFVVGFQNKDDADRFLAALRERLSVFELTLHPKKTRLIEFGRYAAERRKRRGDGKPETFDFLGFTHICSTNRKGYFFIRRKTMKKRLRRKLADVKDKLKKRMHRPLLETGSWLRKVLRGHQNYYGVPGNLDQLKEFYTQVVRMWLASIRRRSQKGKDKWTWERFEIYRAWLLPRLQVVHPFPDIRFDVKHSR
jgi:group II intron reverse transcriptase/maturase